MRGRRNWITALPLAASLLLGACGKPPEEGHEIDEPYTLEEVEGTELARVILTARAAERLGVETAPVADAGGLLLVPSAAVMIDAEGTYWVYTNPEPLVFLRHEITVEREDGQNTYVSAGPPVGTLVATLGVQELWGAEIEIGH